MRAIGWLVHDDKKVYQYGIKRLHVPFDHYYEFIAGLPISAMINRRVKRQARRNLWRRKSRRKNLQHFLNMTNIPIRTRTELLQLRIKALDEKLTPEELGIVLLALQKKRGYKSLRGVSDNDGSDYLQAIATHEENRKPYRSIAEYLLTLDSSTNVIFNRESYEEEFNLIADAQEIEDDTRQKLYGLIYYQNPLKKGTVSKCKYETNRSVTHASNPTYQIFRVWRDVNNITVWDREQNFVEIPQDIRKQWVEKLNRGLKITKAVVCRDLGLKPSSKYEWLSGKFIAPNPIAIFEKLGLEEANFHDLWQEIYSATDENTLRRHLEGKYVLTNFQLDQLLDIDFSTLGWSAVSCKAIRRLLPQLREGKKLRQAIMDTYGKADFQQVELRNWMVEKHYKAYASLVEKIKEKHKIEKVFFEIDYSLKSGNKQRKSNAKRRRAKERKAKEFPSYNEYQLLKVQLWEESKGYSPFVAGYEIPLEEVVTDDWSIDHIVPKSKIYESGYANMVLCPTELNKEKGNEYTGIEFAQQIGVEEWYTKIADTFTGKKKEYLYMTTPNIPRDHISKRQNSDYNTKCFATIGGATNIPNKLITRYLRQWEIPSYDTDDCRHYLAKAFVLANFDQDSIRYFDNLQDREHDPYGIVPTLDPIDIENAPIYFQRLKFTRKTKYGHIPRHSLHKETVYGQRREETRDAKGRLKTSYFYKVRQPMATITAPMVGKIMDKRIKELVQKRIEKTGSHTKMLESIIDRPIRHNGEPIKSVSIRTNATAVVPIHSHDGKGNTGPLGKYPYQCDYVFPATNYAIHINHASNGKMVREIITLIDQMRNLNQEEIKGYEGLLLQANNIIRMEGKEYFLIGASSAPVLRPIYTLSATDNRRLNIGDFAKLEKLKKNELGEIKEITPICPSQE